jgi:hypothetical protein
MQGEASRTRDEYSAPHSTGALFRQRTGQVCRLQGGLRGTSWGHIVCQKGGHAACPFRNKCGGRAAQSPYVMLYPLAYVTDNKSCGSVRPSTEWGAEALRIEPRHASIPDPCLGHDTSSRGTLLWVVRSSLGGVQTLSNGSGLLYFRGPGCAYRGPVPSGSDGVVSENATLTAHEILLGCSPRG